LLKCCTSNQNEIYTNSVYTSHYFIYSDDDSDDENDMDIDTQHQYTEYSHNEIINRCKFGNNHIIQTRLLSDGSIFKQQDQDGIREYNR
jgi:hypothetical protein